MASLFTKQYSSPIHRENSLETVTKEALRVSNGQAFKTFRQMEQDPIIGGAMAFIRGTLNKPFSFKAHPQSSKKERELVDALNQSISDLSPYSQNRVMSNVLTMISYGCSIQEVTWHRVNGKVVFKSFSPVALEQVNKFNFEKGYLKSIELRPPENDGLIVQHTASPTKINGDKLLFTAFQADSSLAPLGKSLLHSAFTTYKQKIVYCELGVIGASKSLAGVMKVEVPSEYLNSYFSGETNDQSILVENLLRGAELMGQGKTSMICIPSDTTESNSKLFDVTPISGVDKGGFELEASIERCNRELHQALQASVLSLGQDTSSGSGSYGLSSTKSMLLHEFLKVVHATIASEMRSILAKTFELNGITDTKHLPEVVFDEMQEPSWEEFTAGMKDLGNSGLVEPTGELDFWIKERIGAPTQGGSGSLMGSLREQQGENDE